MTEELIKIPCLVYSRVVGYLTPVENWNTGKAQEFADRVVFALPAAEELEARIKQDLLPEDGVGARSLTMFHRGVSRRGG